MEPEGDDEEFTADRRGLFDTASDAYRDGRPGYPEEVFSILADHGGLGPGAKVCEVGPGTGQATGPMLAAGAEVVAVELGPDLAALLAEQYRTSALTIKVGPFEEVAAAGANSAGDPDLVAGGFDLVVSATAFHWVPKPEGLEHCHRLLRREGVLALWWNFFGDVTRPDPFHLAIQPLLAERAPALLRHDASAQGANPYALDVEARVGEIDQTGLFGPVQHHRVQWTGRHTAKEVRTMFASFSPWIALEPAVREPLLDELERLATDRFDGVVERPYNTAMYIAERR